MSMQVDPFPVVPAADLEEPDVSRRWLVEGIWARAGVGIIGGLPKCGKSWLGLDLAISIASGTPCLDTFRVVDPGGALIYMAEDATSIVKERLLGVCRHRGLDLGGLPIGVITAPTVRLDLPQDQHRLFETVRKHAPRLLLLDPFVRLHRINENQAADVSAVLGYLRELQRAHDVAVLVVHHARKNGGPATGGQSLRGSGDFFAWVDTALSLRRQRQRIVLNIEHRSAGAGPPVVLTLIGGDSDHEDTHLAVVTDEPEPSTTGNESAPVDLEAAVLAALERAPGRAMQRAAIRAAVRVRNERLGDALARLAAAGKILRRGDVWATSTIPIPDSQH